MYEKHPTKDKLLFEEHLGLVHMAVKRFAHRGIFDREELVQIGSIGLWKAIRNYQEEKGYAFSTYAVPMIIGEIQMAYRKDAPIHLSRSKKEKISKIARIKEQWMKEYNRNPTIEELEHLLGLEREELLELLDAEHGILSLDAPLEEEDAACLGDLLMDAKDESEGMVDRITIEQMMEDLPMLERRLIQLRYFHNCTQKETAQILLMNQVAVSRLEKKVLCKLRMSYNGGDRGKDTRR